MSALIARLWSLRHGTFPPVLERELRGWARRPLFFWLRGLLALALGFQGYELLEHFVVAPPGQAGSLAVAPPTTILPGAEVLHRMTWVLFLAVLFLGVVGADSIQRERREGTLGLLLLTDLKPGEIVRGKLLSCGLSSLAVLLGGLPALMIPVLAGGVRGSEATLSGLGLLNSLFVVLAAGLWMASRFRERRHALAATLGLVATLAFGPEILGSAVLGFGAAPMFRCLGLAGWTVLAQVPVILTPLFVCWFILINAVGWLFLWLASRALARTWKDQSHPQVRAPDPSLQLPELPTPPVISDPELLLMESSAVDESSVIEAPARASWLTDPRPWDADPVRWRVAQLGGSEGLLWLAVGLNFFAQFGVLGSGTASGRWGLLSFLSLAVIAASGGLVAWTGARFFQDSRRQQDLELLLTTPAGAAGILSGQWRALRRSLAWPVGLLLAVGAPAGLSLLYDLVTGGGGDPWPLLQPFLIAVNLALEVAALCWAGMWFGLRCRNKITSAAATVGLVQLLPLLLAVGLMWLWVAFPGHALFSLELRHDMPPVIVALLFFVLKNVCVILWAPWQLRRELRLQRGLTR